MREITENDIPGLNKLAPVEWNFDYETFLFTHIHKDFFHAFVQIDEGQIVGTGNILFKGETAWLANIMVDKDHRGKGLGLLMTKFLVNYLEKQNCSTQLLIATDLGAAVYGKVGFTKIVDYQCYS